MNKKEILKSAGIFFGIVLLLFSMFQIINEDLDDEIDRGLGIERKGLTGFAIQNDSLEEIVITKEEAAAAIEKSKLVIEKMVVEEFSLEKVNDLLIEAELVFEQAKFADILRNSNHPGDRAAATNALRLVDWEDINYNDVIEITDKIESRRERALLLEDMIIIRKTSKDGFGEHSRLLLEETELAFKDGRYDNVDELLISLRDSIEKEKEDNSFASNLKDNAKNFVQRYWEGLLILFIILVVGGYLSNKGIRKRLLKEKIRKMKHERAVLVHLIKKAQIERFKKNIIPELVYNIRVKKYKDRMHKIDQELPVLESRLGNKKEVTKKNV